MALSGKNTVVSVSTTSGGTYTVVAETNEVSRSFTAGNEDITVFGNSWTARKQQLKDATYSLSGFTNQTDTLGQTVILNSFINGTDLFIKVLFDGTNGYIQKVVVDSIEDSGDPSTPIGRSIELSGDGAPTATP